MEKSFEFNVFESNVFQFNVFELSVKTTCKLKWKGRDARFDTLTILSGKDYGG